MSKPRLVSDTSSELALAALRPSEYTAALIQVLQAKAAVMPAISSPPPPVVATAPVAADTCAAAPVGSLKDIARQAARGAEKELIYRTLQQTRWNRREAAEILGISYKALLYKIKEAELDKAS